MEPTFIKKDYRAERFQFVLSVNENIICQRFFKINGFNLESLNSLQLKETIDTIVERVLGSDLTSKSRTYMWYTYDENYQDNEYSNPLDEAWSTTFKFSFLVDGKEVISKVWDGTVYPKFVRESVDIVNKKYRFDYMEGRMNFETSLARKMVIDKPDLTYIIINLLCDVCSMTYTNQYDYTLQGQYGKNNYKFLGSSPYEQWVKKIEKQELSKTKNYLENLY